MSLKWVVLLGLGLAVEAAAEDLRSTARGLDVLVERVEGEVALNGVPVTISRAVGPGVTVLAERLVDRWRRESGQGSVRILQCCGWQVASRIHNGESQVVQWRTAGTQSELLWSTLGDPAPIPAPPKPKTPLPADCSWSGTIHGKVAGSHYLQISAQCALDAESALDLMIRRLADEGWHWQRHGRLVVSAGRGQVRAQLVASPVRGPATSPSRGQSSLVLLESRSARGPSR